MAHASGNPTWVDYPSTTTLITAASLENIERQIDRAAGNAPSAMIYQVNAQSIANNTWTAVAMDGSAYDPYGCHSNSSSPSRFVIPSGWNGDYLFTGTAWLANGTGVFSAAWYKNGVSVRGTATRVGAPPDGFGGSVAPVATLIPNLVAGDYVELWVLQAQSNGNAVNTYTTSPSTSSMSVSYYRPA